MPQRFAVIIAGGHGERFWPASRRQKPKHLLSLVDSKPLLVQTVERLEGLVPAENIFILTQQSQRPTVLKLCSSLRPDRVVGEPVGRDTAAAVGLATLLVRRIDPEGVFAVLPSDHVIRDKKGFQCTLNAAFEAALQEPLLVTIGIPPKEASTAYGYLQKGALHTHVRGQPVYAVRRFIEKPDATTARNYLNTRGGYYWNAGMFVWQTSAIEQALVTCAPKLAQGLNTLAKRLESGVALDTVLSEHYPKFEKTSIDYAVMEKAGKVVTLEARFDWDDVGSWPAVAQHLQTDSFDNAVCGQAFIQDGRSNLVVSRDNHLVALLGVENLIVIHTDDATLVCPKSKAQDIKQLVRQLSNGKKPFQKWL